MHASLYGQVDPSPGPNSNPNPDLNPNPNPNPTQARAYPYYGRALLATSGLPLTTSCLLPRYKPASMAKLARADPKANLRAGLKRQLTVCKAVSALTEVYIPEADSGGSNGSNGCGRSKSPLKSMLRLSPAKTGRKLMIKPPADLEEGGGHVSAGSVRLSPRKLGRRLLGEKKSPWPETLKADTQADKGEDVTEAVAGSRFGANMKLVIVHAINDAEDGCEFEHFFSTTPPDLVQAVILLLTTTTDDLLLTTYYCLLSTVY